MGDNPHPPRHTTKRPGDKVHAVVVQRRVFSGICLNKKKKRNRCFWSCVHVKVQKIADARFVETHTRREEKHSPPCCRTDL